MDAKEQPYEIKCEKCNGLGETTGKRCSKCFGRGYVLTRAGLAEAREFDARLYELWSS
jgi:DnaJ-class molecular chaperone